MVEVIRFKNNLCYTPTIVGRLIVDCPYPSDKTDRCYQIITKLWGLNLLTKIFAFDKFIFTSLNTQFPPFFDHLNKHQLNYLEFTGIF